MIGMLVGLGPEPEERVGDGAHSAVLSATSRTGCAAQGGRACLFGLAEPAVHALHALRADPLQNALLAVPDPNACIMKKCTVFPVEFVCRGFMTGGCSDHFSSCVCVREKCTVFPMEFVCRGITTGVLGCGGQLLWGAGEGHSWQARQLP